jgi:adenosylmethionine-8-amino-7-oxononanoate aminotransferase
LGRFDKLRGRSYVLARAQVLLFESDEMTLSAVVRADQTFVFPRELDRVYPVMDRGSGMRLFDTSGDAFLDCVGGGAMVASLGYGVSEIAAAAEAQIHRLPYIYNQQLTSQPQERLAEELTRIAPNFARVRFMSGGAEANEMALRLARSYHVERGDIERWQIISPAQAYHGPTMATLALTGRPGLQYPYEPYFANHLHIPPASWRFDPTGEAALAALDAAIEACSPPGPAAFFCEPISAAALPAYSPPNRFWEGLAERRTRHGFLVCFDEVVTGIGRTGTWFAADQLPITPDIIVTAKGLGAGYAPIGALLCRADVYEAIAGGSRRFEHGHTWDGAPLSCAVGLAVLSYLKTHRLVERVAELGRRLLDELTDALIGLDIVREVRGRGFLFGIDYVDPRDGSSFLDPDLHVARRIDIEALNRRLILYSTQSTFDRYTGDQTVIAPAFNASESDLSSMIERVAETVTAVDGFVKKSLVERGRVRVTSAD